MNEQLLREQFHDWLESQGFARPATPKREYPSSHVQLLWQAYLHATKMATTH
jgi:hypothetical protein